MTEDNKKRVYFGRPKGDSYEEYKAWFMEFAAFMLGPEKVKDINEEMLHELHDDYMEAKNQKNKEQTDE
jgi:hypothetical protein